MVARDSFGSAIFEDEEQGTSTRYGNSAEEMEDIEEELQVLALDTSLQGIRKSFIILGRVHALLN